MDEKFTSTHWLRLACSVFFLPLVLAGCGGSSSSSSPAAMPTNDPLATASAVISQSSSILGNADYTLNLSPTGVAAYNLYSFSPTAGNSPPVPGPTQTGTVPAALTAQFFKDLTAAMPLQNLPETYSGGSVGSDTIILQYGGQTGDLNDLSDAREQALETDIQAIAKALGLPQG